jgi:transposase-like protein
MTEHGVELVEGLVRRQKVDGRCVYDRAAKAELVRRCREPGVSVARMALAHGVNANLLRKWIKMTPVIEMAAPTRRAASLVPVRVGRSESTSAEAGYLELSVDGAKIRVHGEVSTAMLQRALQCLARST